MSDVSAAASSEAHAAAPGASPAPPWARAFLLILLLGPAVLAAASVRTKSWTWDEPIYLAGGHYLYYTGNFRIKPISYHPPLAFYLNSLGLAPLRLPANLFPPASRDHARQVGLRVTYDSGHPPEIVRFLARLPFLCLIPLMGLLVYAWSRDVWGWQAGLLSLWLVSWSPTLLAHARLVATDYLFTLTCVATLWSARLLLRGGGTWRLLRTGVCAGLTCLAKFSAIILVPIALVAAWFAARRTHEPGWQRWAVKRVLVGLGMVVGLAGVVVWLGYFGQFAPALVHPGERAAVARMAPPSGIVDRAMYELYRSRVRLPAVSYVMGFFSQYAHGAGGHSNYLLGEVRGTGWWYYFPVAVLVKTPLPELAFWIVGAAAWWRTGRRREWLWLVAAPAVLLLLSTRSNITIGVRHVLLLYPVGAIVAGAVMRWRDRRWVRGGVLAGAVWLAGATLSVYPHYLTYFNPIAGGPRHGHRVLVDSNLDWGQDLDALFARARAEHWLPLRVQYFGPPGAMDYAPADISPLEHPCEPTTGYVAVSVTNRVGAYMPGGADCLRWLDRFEPIARVNHTIWVYDIPEGNGPHGAP